MRARLSHSVALTEEQKEEKERRERLLRNERMYARGHIGIKKKKIGTHLEFMNESG